MKEKVLREFSIVIDVKQTEYESRNIATMVTLTFKDTKEDWSFAQIEDSKVPKSRPFNETTMARIPRLIKTMLTKAFFFPVAQKIIDGIEWHDPKDLEDALWLHDIKF